MSIADDSLPLADLPRWRLSDGVEIHRWLDEAEALCFDRRSADTFVLGVTELQLLDIASSESLNTAEIVKRFAGEHALDGDPEMYFDIEEMLRELAARGLVVRLVA